MDIISYALSKKGIINVDGKQYKPELKDGEIVYKKVEEPGDYTTFAVGEAGELKIANVSNTSIEELYINNIPQELPVGAYYYEGTNYNVKTNDIIKIKGRFNLCNDGLRITNIILQNDLTNCDYMFAGCDGLTEAPVIPSSVTSCDYMFQSCIGLTEAPVIPSSVTSCNYMFQSCINLTKAPEIPSSVISCSWMFQRCISLTEAPIIPANVMDCSYMFQGCESLTTIPQANINLIDNPPATLIIYNDCYSDCTNIVNPISYDEIPQAWGGNKVEKPETPEEPEIPTVEYTTFTIKNDCNMMIFINGVAEPAMTELYIDGEQQELPEKQKTYNVREGQEVKIKGHFMLSNANIAEVKLQSNLTDCNRMFSSCELSVAPIIPNGVTNCEGMFSGCASLIEAPVIPSTVTNCDNMFSYCTNLTEAPIIPNSVTNCNSMFDGCASLTEAPVIPEGVTDCGNMFFFCGNLEKLPQENVDLMYNHNDELEHHSCYSCCDKINDPISYDEIPDDWK